MEAKTMAKKLTLSDVEIVLRVEPDSEPVRGNALASGDDALDREVEDQIIARLDGGDVWAWAFVTVEARYAGLVGKDHLGACSYNDEKDFRTPGGYFDDMKAEALADLQRQIDELAPKICECP